MGVVTPKLGIRGWRHYQTPRVQLIIFKSNKLIIIIYILLPCLIFQSSFTFLFSQNMDICCTYMITITVNHFNTYIFVPLFQLQQLQHIWEIDHKSFRIRSYKLGSIRNISKTLLFIRSFVRTHNPVMFHCKNTTWDWILTNLSCLQYEFNETTYPDFKNSRRNRDHSCCLIIRLTTGIFYSCVYIQWYGLAHYNIAWKTGH